MKTTCSLYLILIGLMIPSIITGCKYLSEEKDSLFIKNVTLITMNDRNEILSDGYILIYQGRILSLGRMEDWNPNRIAEELKSQSESTFSRQVSASALKSLPIWDAKGKVAMPGLVNTHTHLAMTLLRGLGDDNELNEWLEKYIFPIEANFLSEDYVRVGTRLGLAEMIRGGITTYADMYYFEDVVAEETDRSGMRGILGQTLLDFATPDRKDWQSGNESLERFLDRWKDHDRITPGLAPHAIYTVSRDHLMEVESLSKQWNLPILMHVAEAPAETDYSLRKYRMRPIAYLESLGILSERLVAAHMVQVERSEIELLKKRNVGIAHCPQSNMKLVSGVAPIPYMTKENLRVGLGTDGAASNNDLNLWEEMDTAAKLHKLFTGNPKTLPAVDVLRMATIGGARALHMEDKIGSLEKGKYADIIFLDLNQLELTPLYNYYSHLVYSVKSHHVTDSMVHGRWIMKNRDLVHMEEKKVLLDAQEYQEKIRTAILELQN